MQLQFITLTNNVFILLCVYLDTCMQTYKYKIPVRMRWIQTPLHRDVHLQVFQRTHHIVLQYVQSYHVDCGCIVYELIVIIIIIMQVEQVMQHTYIYAMHVYDNAAPILTFHTSIYIYMRIPQFFQRIYKRGMCICFTLHIIDQFQYIYGT